MYLFDKAKNYMELPKKVITKIRTDNYFQSNLENCII